MNPLTHEIPFWAAAVPTIAAVIVIRLVSFGRDNE